LTTDSACVFINADLQERYQAWAEKRWQRKGIAPTGFGFITFLHRSARCLGGRKGNLKP
jgi:hypothetical protein